MHKYNDYKNTHDNDDVYLQSALMNLTLSTKDRRDNNNTLSTLTDCNSLPSEYETTVYPMQHHRTPIKSLDIGLNKRSVANISVTPSAKKNLHKTKRRGWNFSGLFNRKLTTNLNTLNINFTPPHSPRSSPGASPKGNFLLPAQDYQDNGKLTVVLDLDETLIHSEFTGDKTHGRSLAAIMRQAEKRKSVTGQVAPDFTFVLYAGAPNEEVIHVYKRPGVDEFLSTLAEFCEVIIFTASLPVYARPILAWLDPNKLCRHALFRDSTIPYKNYPHVKSLKRLGRNMRRTILVDNSPYAMLADPDNGIPIKAFYDDPYDEELPKLLKFIRNVSGKRDVRNSVKRKYQLPAKLASMGFGSTGSIGA